MESKIKLALGEQLFSILAMQVRIEQLQKENDDLKDDLKVAARVADIEKANPDAR